MSVVDTTMEADDRTLVLTRLIAAPPANLYRAWTEPALMKQWFAPLPWTTPHAEVDVRPGGSSLVVMRDPDGTEFPNRGVYLDVQPNRRLVFTDAYVRAWEPSAKPFMTVVLSFAEEASGTLYTARVHHWTAEDRKTHEAMGFHQGWGQCADQLASLMARL
jgi:uncharacterized protein YndB with AHSA1/START domain